MHAVGDDVWTPAAVRYIKVLACQELWRALEGVLSGREIGDIITNGADEEAYQSVEAVEPTEAVDAGGNGTDDSEDHGEHYNEMEEEEEDEEQEEEEEEEEEPTVKTEEQDTHVEQNNDSDEEKARVNGDRHKRMIGLDWAIQLLFDALYLDEALQRKRSSSRSSGISSLAGKMEATVGIRVSPFFTIHSMVWSLTKVCSSVSTRN